MNHVYKPDFYDNFRCIADECSFTCCVGWDISVDKDTYDKWKNSTESSDTYVKNIKQKKSRGKSEYYIKMGSKKCCPFLDEKKLCSIVIKNGEEYQPKTCRTFPRIENCHNDLQELSLSCACPAVVDMIFGLNEKIKFVINYDKIIQDKLPFEYNVREAMINIVQNNKFTFRDRILLVFQMLLAIKKELAKTKEIISQYQDEDYLLSLSELWQGIKIKNEDFLLETNELFLDIVENYRNEKEYRPYLEDITRFAETLDIKESLKKWNELNRKLNQYDQWMYNCIISKIFSCCICEDIDDMIMQYQIILTEYVMVRHSVFLLSLMNNNAGDASGLKQPTFIKHELKMMNDIRDFIVVYSRIIGNNAEGIREFWEGSFDEAVWDFGYVLLILNN